MCLAVVEVDEGREEEEGEEDLTVVVAEVEGEDILVEVLEDRGVVQRVVETNNELFSNCSNWMHLARQLKPDCFVFVLKLQQIFEG